jgi:hypothetical protein
MSKVVISGMPIAAASYPHPFNVNMYLKAYMRGPTAYLSDLCEAWRAGQNMHLSRPAYFFIAPPSPPPLQPHFSPPANRGQVRGCLQPSPHFFSNCGLSCELAELEFLKSLWGLGTEEE